eukprot:scaffold22326_cov43-Tisochrysis_lutea.AAC.1
MGPGEGSEKWRQSRKAKLVHGTLAVHTRQHHLRLGLRQTEDMVGACIPLKLSARFVSDMEYSSRGEEWCRILVKDSVRTNRALIPGSTIDDTGKWERRQQI